jgi:hypothetical protein
MNSTDNFALNKRKQQFLESEEEEVLLPRVLAMTARK